VRHHISDIGPAGRAFRHHAYGQSGSGVLYWEHCMPWEKADDP
jgi:hypothetical protein